MYAHGIEILHGANDDDIVVGVAQQFQLEFFPAQHSLFYEHFMNRGGLEPPVKGFIQFILVMNKAAAGAPEGERRSDHQRETYLLGKFFPFEEGICRFGSGDRHPQSDHPLAELFPVFCLVNRLDVHTDQPDSILFPDAQVFRLFSQVERCLTAHGRQDSVDLILFQDLFDTFYRQR